MVPSVATATDVYSPMRPGRLGGPQVWLQSSPQPVCVVLALPALPLPPHEQPWLVAATRPSELTATAAARRRRAASTPSPARTARAASSVGSRVAPGVEQPHAEPADCSVGS